MVPEKYNLGKEMLEYLNVPLSGTFYRKGTTEYVFDSLNINEGKLFLKDKSEIIYPHLIFSGKGNFGEKIKLDLVPKGFKKRDFSGFDDEVNELEGFLEIKGEGENYSAEGNIKDYWNGIFWIDKDSVNTDRDELRNIGTFLYVIEK